MNIKELKPGALFVSTDSRDLLIFKEKDTNKRWSGQYGRIKKDDICLLVEVVVLDHSPMPDGSTIDFDLWFWSPNASGWRIMSFKEVQEGFKLIRKAPYNNEH